MKAHMQFFATQRKRRRLLLELLEPRRVLTTEGLVETPSSYLESDFSTEYSTEYPAFYDSSDMFGVVDQAFANLPVEDYLAANFEDDLVNGFSPSIDQIFEDYPSDAGGTEAYDYSTETYDYSTETNDYSTETNDYSTETNDYSTETNDYSTETYDYSTETYDYSTETYDYSTETYDYATETYDYATETYDYATETYDYATETYDYSTETYDYATETYDYATETYDYATETYDYATETYDYATETYGDSTETYDTSESYDYPDSGESYDTNESESGETDHDNDTDSDEDTDEDNDPKSDFKKSQDDADEQYDSDIAAAETDFQSAQLAAETAYQAALAAFTGSLTTLNVPPFDLNVGRPLTEVAFPDDSSQPLPPKSKPTYTGPAFDLESDPSYQADKAAAENKLNSAIAAANEKRRDDDTTSREKYEDAIQKRQDLDNDEWTTISNDYITAINDDAPGGVPLTDIEAAATTFHDGIQDAQNTFHDTIESSQNTRNGDIETAYQTLIGITPTYQNSYDTTAETAYDDYHDALNTDPPPSDEQRVQARKDYDQALLDAGKQRDSDIAQANHDYQVAVIEANRTFALAYADAVKTISETFRSLRKAYDNALADYAKEVANREADAVAARDQSGANLRHTSNTERNNAKKDYEYELADNAYSETVALKNAQSQYLVDLATAQRDAIQQWDMVTNTPWTNYQLQLAENQLDYAGNLKTARNTHTLTLANAEKDQAKAKVDADHALEKSLVDQTHVKAPDRIASQKKHRKDTITADWNAAKALADAGEKIDETLTNAAHDRAGAGIQSYYNYAMSLADASLAYSLAMINGRRLYKPVMASVAADAGSAYARAVNNANRAITIDMINQEAAFASVAREAWYDFNQDNLEAEGDRKDAHAESDKVLNDDLISQGTGTAIAAVQAHVNHAKAINAATLIYVQAVAPADKIYDDKFVQETEDTNVDDATALRDYYRAEANAYKTIIHNWHSSTNTVWSQFHADLATDEYTWAFDVGAAEVTFAEDMRDAETTRQNERSEVTKNLRLDTAVAAKIRDDSLQDDKVTFVTTIAGANETASLAENDIANTRVGQQIDRTEETAEDQREFALEHANDAADAEKAYRIAMINADTDYSNAAIAANAELQGTIGDSYEIYSDGQYDTEEEQDTAWNDHLDNIEDAVDTYNDDMQTATDDYNDAGQTATDDVKAARKDLFKRWAEHYAKNRQQLEKAEESDDEIANIKSTSTAHRDLAQAILDPTTALVNKRKGTLDAYATTVNNL